MPSALPAHAKAWRRRLRMLDILLILAGCAAILGMVGYAELCERI